MKHQPPGLLRVRMNPDLVMMVCTAGHVDHGKTQLVKLLTGCNTDRLKEEQERGLTIELGFAPCVLQSDIYVGIVDVPGHDKFIKNMVAGVSGIGMAILVIAADDGIMPQTVEHLQILELLGIRNGMVALTKIDLVGQERVEELQEEIRMFLEGTFLEQAAICPVSSETLDGFDRFYETLVREVKGLVRSRVAGVFRMPVLNTFSRAGFGSVVTGIPVTGTIQVGDPVELVPGKLRGRVRGIQRFLRDATDGGYGQCLALNIPEFSKNPPVRGQVICQPGYLEACQVFHLKLQVVSSVERPLENAEQVKLHTGTSEEKGKLYLLEGKSLGQGQKGLATILLSEPVAAAVGDKFIIRRASPAATIAGGEILAVSPTGGRGRKKQVLEMLQAHEAFLSGVDAASPEGTARKIEYFLVSHRPAGAPLKEIAQGTMLTLEVTREHLSNLRQAGKVLEPASEWYIHADSYGLRLDEATSRIKEAAAAGKSLSLSITDFRKGLNWHASLWNRIQEDLESKKLVTRRGDRFVLETAVEKLGDKDHELMEKVLAVYDEQGFQSPRPEELAEKLRVPPEAVERLIDYLCNRGKLFRLSKNVVLSHEWMKRAQELVIKIITKKGSLDSADFKYHLNSTRKYALAILDFLDARRITVRSGNIRSLASEYRRNLL